MIRIFKNEQYELFYNIGVIIYRSFSYINLIIDLYSSIIAYLVSKNPERRSNFSRKSNHSLDQLKFEHFGQLFDRKNLPHAHLTP